MVVVVVDDEGFLKWMFVWGEVSDGEGYGWGLRCRTPINSVLDRIWKGGRRLIQ